MREDGFESVVVCARCKTENEAGRIRCVKCGNNVTARGEYAEQKGPKVVVLGSIEDLRRAREAGEIDTSDDDPDALGWLGSDEVDEAPISEPDARSTTRRVSVREIDKISGLRELRDIQKALIEAESSPPKTAPPPRREPVRPGTGRVERKSEERKVERPEERRDERKTEDRRVERPDDQRDEGSIVAWLVNELLPDPFGLTATRSYLMGRDPRASLFLPSNEVSRRHAGIKADEKGNFWVEDLRSRNGTYVNGHAVLKRRLREGDRLDVGPFSFRFARATPNAPPPRDSFDPNEETRTLRAMPGALTAEIEPGSVVALIAMLHERGRSGVVTLRAGAQVGRIFLIEGEVHHAQFGKYKGDDALAALLPAEAGTLHFQDEKIKVPRTVQRLTAEILAAGR